MSLMQTIDKKIGWTTFLMQTILAFLTVSILAELDARAAPPFSEGSRVLTLKNASQTDSLQYGLNENATIKFTTTDNHQKAELTIEDYRESKAYLDKADMTETDNGDGTYSYTYTFNTNTLFGGAADWYYFKTDFTTPNAEQKGYFMVGSAGTPHAIKTYADAAYTQAADSFDLAATAYIEVIGKDNGNTVKKKKIKVANYSGSKHIDSKIGTLSNNNGVFRFSLDLSTASPAPTSDWWFTLEVEIEQNKNKGEKGGISFIGSKQIRITAGPPGGGKTWTQQKWREVN